MAKPDLFTQIIEGIEREAGPGGFINIQEKTLKALNTDMPPAGSTRQGKPDAAPDPGRNQDIGALEKKVSSCVICPLHSTRTRTVFGDGDSNAELMFIGEGPGRDEDLQGVPFVGRAGQLLTRMISAMRFDRSQVYIANIVKCRPPKNRNPEEDEMKACLPYLQEQIRLVSPKVIVLLGAVPLKALLGKTGVTKVHGQWHEYMGVRTMPSLHPAYLLRNPAAKRDAWEDLKKVMRELGKSP